METPNTAMKEYEKALDEASYYSELAQDMSEQAQLDLVEWFFKWMKSKKLSLRQTAIKLKISAAYLSDVKNGRRGLSYELFEKIKTLTTK